MQQKDSRKVIICYQGVEVQTEFAQETTLEQMINSFFKGKQHIDLAYSAFKAKGKQFVPIKQPAKAQVRVNTLEGQYCKKFLRLNQYQKKKRLRFYVYPKPNTQAKKLKQEFSMQDIEKIKQVQIFLASETGIQKEGNKYTVQVDQFNNFNEIFDFLKDKFQFPEAVQFKFKNAQEQKILNPTKQTNFRQFLIQNNIRRLHAIPIFTAG